MANTKLSAFLSLLLVFASGIVVGGFGYHAYSRSRVTPPVRPPEKQDPEVRRRQIVDEMTREVHLDPAQVVELKQIYEDTRSDWEAARSDFNTKLRAQGQAIHDQQVDKIKKILRPEQVPLYDALRARHEAERAARHKGGDIRKDQQPK